MVTNGRPWRIFKVNDEAFSFFTELEMKLRHHLINIFNENAELRKESIIDSLMADEDILFSWIFVLGEVYEPDESIELLREVIELWLTIRGFSAAGAWMEYYKQNKKEERMDCEKNLLRTILRMVNYNR